MESDLLNEPDDWRLGPDYGYQMGRPDNLARFDARSGERYVRRLSARGYVFQLSWLERPLVTREALEQWQNQFEGDFFTFYDAERDRYFSGNFDSPLVFTPAGYEKWNVTGVFTEIPGLPMYEYPDDWGRDGIFLEERDDLGNDLFSLTGSWTYRQIAGAHGAASGEYYSNTSGDTAEAVYFGYGFRYWARQDPTLGAVILYLDDVNLGQVDPGSGATGGAAALFEALNVPLGLHRVKIQVAPPLEGVACGIADAIEVMR